MANSRMSMVCTLDGMNLEGESPRARRPTAVEPKTPSPVAKLGLGRILCDATIVFEIRQKECARVGPPSEWCETRAHGFHLTFVRDSDRRQKLRYGVVGRWSHTRRGVAS